MRRADILSGTPLRVAALSAGLFLLVLAGIGTGLVLTVQQRLTAQYDNQITEEIELFRQIYQTEGRAGLIHSIDMLARHSVPSHRTATLFDHSGARLAGDLPIAPAMLGWQQVQIRGAGLAAHDTSLYLNAVRIDELTIVVGRRLDLVHTAIESMIRVLAISGALVAAGILLIGAIGSWSTLGKLQVMEETLAQVAEGDSKARLPVSFKDDQIDRISEQMNHHLDRLARLMQGMQTSAAAIAHDLKTPLTHAFVALQQAQTAKGDAQDHIDAALAELDRLNGVFDTILRIARIQGGGARAEFTPVDASEALADVADMLTPAGEAKGQSITLDTAPGVTLTGDGKMIRLMLANLVQNAIQHCPPGTDIRMTARMEGPRPCLEVIDNGPGVPESERAHITDAFVRVDSARASEGSGLGLALVKAIAERHGAELQLHNLNPGLGVGVLFPAPQAETVRGAVAK
ncbi:HAMP domain-containing sensor histidine kinase [Aquicoccus sp. G2-2]|uniref:sensor histidine kinase n=1 Tax=Aquicoccus sp. G2-2 TaxID=3092120 RepID=UPI002AE09D91|nr:HAMP domain-containing sensor histidine kinase [Aquicoccus sp. G2-2]MEA1114860.1 HAMP domain-containing sensor histidine kinase [Aquicoccus sp. G2-2]